MAHYRYALDATGNRTRVTENVGGVTRGISYTYDALYRLTAADYSMGENYAYQYDAVGNRTAMTDTVAHTYVYDAANRLTNADGVLYTWDNRGNLLADGTFTYTYNAAGRLVQAQSLTTTLVYTYNADGLRVAQAVNSDVSAFVWDWASGVPELLSDGDSLYLIGYDTLGWQTGADWTFVLPDALGSVRQETDAAGAVTVAREWSPYGVEVGGTQAGLGFTGEWYDAAVGLTYLRARWLDVETGRFTTADKWPGYMQAPSSLHRWNYTKANPVCFKDSTGFFPELSDVEGGYAEFTCQCGWIDWNHFNASNERVFTLIDDLKYAMGYYTANYNNIFFLSQLPNSYIHFGISLGQWGIEFDLFHGIAAIPDSVLNEDTAVDLAVSIFMDANEQFEELQGSWGQFVPKLAASYYSEEDLSSDILGFYAALKRQETGVSTEVIKEEIRTSCAAVGSEKSRDAFIDIYQNGALGMTNWRNWFPRFVPISSDKCYGDKCIEPRYWPSQFTNLTSRRVFPSWPGGKWWWLSSDSSINYQHYPIFTTRPNVFRIAVDSSQY